MLQAVFKPLLNTPSYIPDISLSIQSIILSLSLLLKCMYYMYLLCWTICDFKGKEIRQNSASTENFDICFFELLDCYWQKPFQEGILSTGLCLYSVLRFSKYFLILQDLKVFRQLMSQLLNKVYHSTSRHILIVVNKACTEIRKFPIMIIGF